MTETDLDRVLLLLEADFRKLSGFADKLPDLSDRDTERRKEAIRLMADFRKHLDELKAARG